MTRDRYAEMPDLQKNKLSHRYKALEKLRAHLHLQALPTKASTT